MVKRHDVVKIPVEQVQVGFTLAIPSGGGLPPRVFQLESVTITHRQAEGEPPTVTLSSEPLAHGKPWVLEYPFGTQVVRVVRTYDDGT
jgi:hypothetical protein